MKIVKLKTLVSILLVAMLAFNPVAVASVVDIPTPNGFVREVAADGSFAKYLRHLPLKPNNKIELWDGSELPGSSYDTLAVLGLPLLFDQDLEQCADFTMRIWAEYLRSESQLENLALFDYNGRKRRFSNANKSFKQYLHWHMSHSNSYSIKQGAKRVGSLADLQAGDMFVQNTGDGGIGHVSMVLDSARNDFGLRVFLVGYSFMPAQEFHIERASPALGMAGWFTAQGYQTYANSVFGRFGQAVLMRYE